MKNNRVPTNYAVTRKQKRYIARKNMEDVGKQHICKHSYSTIKQGSFVIYTKIPSEFAKHWREYVEVPA
jgi:hypothetical protein